jgi:hypothetical protein
VLDRLSQLKIVEIALAGSGLLFIPYDKWTIPRSILVIGGYSASFLTMPQ